MFQSVLGQETLYTGRMGTGVGVSLSVHAGVVAAMVALSLRPLAPPPEPEVEVVFRPNMPPPAPPKGSPAPRQTPKTPPKPKRNPMAVPTEVKPLPPEPPRPVEPEQEAPPETPAEPVEGVEGGDPNGVEVGGVLGALVQAGLGVGEGTRSEEGVLDFGEGMQPPKLLSGAPIEYTREALEAQVEGLMIARCTITRTGAVEGCRIVKSLPHMERAVLEALYTRRYRPVYYQGRPVSVSYSFNLRLSLP